MSSQELKKDFKVKHHGRKFLFGSMEEKDFCKVCGNDKGNYSYRELTFKKEVMGSKKYNLEECSKCKTFFIYCCERQILMNSNSDSFFCIFKYFFLDELNKILGTSGVIDFTNEQIKLLEINGVYNGSFFEN